MSSALRYSLLAALLGVVPMAHAATFAQYTASPAHSAQIIDCRNSNYFNGWPEKGATIGGHIPQAININAVWLPTLKPDAFKALIKENNLNPALPTYLYCDDLGTQTLADRLKQNGFSNVKRITQPVTDYSGKLVALPNFQHLVSANWLNNLINGKSVQFAPKDGYKIVDVNWGPATKYLLEHIPNAQYLNTDQIESKPWWNHVDPAKLTQVLKSLGITQNTTAILYGYNTMAAYRAAQIFMFAGVKDVRILNGGFASWQAKDYDTKAFYHTAQPMAFGATIPANPKLIIGIPKVKEMLASPQNNSVVSIQSWAAFVGKTSGYTYIKPKGRIEGAKWGQSGPTAYDLADYYNPDHTLRNPYALAKLWKEWGINKDQNVAFYCGTGWRASVAFFTAYLMGWPHISVFDGGWFQWSGEPHDPIATGSEPVPHP
jgi:thiosulfate/3-mercaptopyruvate sulfurtransferase